MSTSMKEMCPSFIQLVESGLYAELLESLDGQLIKLESCFPLSGRTIMKDYYFSTQSTRIQEIAEKSQAHQDQCLKASGISFHELSKENQELFNTMKKVLYSTFIQEQMLLKTAKSQPLYSLYLPNGKVNNQVWQQQLMDSFPHEDLKDFFTSADDYELIKLNANVKVAIGANGGKGSIAEKAISTLKIKKKEILEGYKKRSKTFVKVDYCQKEVFTQFPLSEQQILYKNIYVKVYSLVQYVRGDTKKLSQFTQFKYSPQSPRLPSDDNTRIFKMIDSVLHSPPDSFKRQVKKNDALSLNNNAAETFKVSTPTITVEISTQKHSSIKNLQVSSPVSCELLKSVIDAPLLKLSKALAKLSFLLNEIGEDFFTSLLTPTLPELQSERADLKPIQEMSHLIFKYKKVFEDIHTNAMKEMNSLK